MSRLPPAGPGSLPGDQQQSYEDLSQIAEKAFGDKFTWRRKDGSLVGPFPFFLAAPEAGKGFLEYLGKLAAIPGLPTEAKEVAIMSTGAHYQAPYELYAHGNIAAKTTKLSSDQVQQICDGKKPEGLNDACIAAYDVAKYLSSTPGPLPTHLWDKSVQALGKDGTVALVHYVGMYAYTCIILNAMDAPVPESGD